MDVCSAYLLEPDRANLILAATLGLRAQCIGNLRMALSEGLAGVVAEQVRPVAVEQVNTHPRFKYFSEAGEDAYNSFLGVPLIDQGVLQGVLVVQTKDARVFSEHEVAMLVEAASAVAPVVSEARNLDRFITPVEERLWALARNLWWSWDNDCCSLFRELDPVRWRQLNQNPISLDREGWQREQYLQTDMSQLPMELAIGTNRQPVTVELETRAGLIRAKVWRVKVGRRDLLLLDSDVIGNAPEDRELTSRLYGGDDQIGSVRNYCSVSEVFVPCRPWESRPEFFI